MNEAPESPDLNFQHSPEILPVLPGKAKFSRSSPGEKAYSPENKGYSPENMGYSPENMGCSPGDLWRMGVFSGDLQRMGLFSGVIPFSLERSREWEVLTDDCE